MNPFSVRCQLELVVSVICLPRILALLCQWSVPYVPAAGPLGLASVEGVATSRRGLRISATLLLLQGAMTLALRSCKVGGTFLHAGRFMKPG